MCNANALNIVYDKHAKNYNEPCANNADKQLTTCKTH